MLLSRSRLYTLVSIACLAGYIWLFYNINFQQQDTPHAGVCLIKRVTSIPCPSCGTTRSIIAVGQGNLLEATLINPLGLLMAIMMAITPIWLTFDLLTKKQSFLDFYRKTEHLLKNQKIAIPVILLVLLNWIWNIYKGL